MGLPPRILFGFELDDAYAWSQVSLAGPRTSSTPVTILDVPSNSILWGAPTRVNDRLRPRVTSHLSLSLVSPWSFSSSPLVVFYPGSINCCINCRALSRVCPYMLPSSFLRSPARARTSNRRKSISKVDWTRSSTRVSISSSAITVIQPRLYIVWYCTTSGFPNWVRVAFGDTCIIDGRCTPHCLTGSGPGPVRRCSWPVPLISLVCSPDSHTSVLINTRHLVSRVKFTPRNVQYFKVHQESRQLFSLADSLCRLKYPKKNKTKHQHCLWPLPL